MSLAAVLSTPAPRHSSCDVLHVIASLRKQNPRVAKPISWSAAASMTPTRVASAPPTGKMVKGGSPASTSGHLWARAPPSARDGLPESGRAATACAPDSHCRCLRSWPRRVQERKGY
jgi:hypothetical protein